MSRPTCETCPYWNAPLSPPAKADRRGQCRIRSTQTNWDISDGLIVKWPPRLHDEWCGEHPDFVVDSAPETKRYDLHDPRSGGTFVEISDVNKADKFCLITSQWANDPKEYCQLPATHKSRCKFAPEKPR